MAENKMKGFAELLGLELNEEFKLSGIVDKYKLTIDGIMRCSPYDKEWLYDNLPMQVLTGKFEIIKLPNPILDDAEKEYLSNFIKPFRNEVLAITKYNYSNGDEYLQIEVNQRNRYEYIKLPYFEKGTMYKGMKLGFVYILKELGL